MDDSSAAHRLTLDDIAVPRVQRHMRIARFVLVATCLAAAPLHAQPKRLTVIEDQKIRDAAVAAYSFGNCGAIPLVPNSAVRGALGNSRCTLSVDGTPVDFYSFDGATDDFFSVDLHANGAAYTNPRVVLIPPPGDFEKPPLLTGSQSITVRWLVTRPARWIIAVGSADPSAHGDYVLGFRSRRLTGSQVPAQCTQQVLQCKQSASAVMSPDSCAFNGLPTDGYLVMAPPGEPVKAEIDAESDFSARLRYRYSGASFSSTTSLNGHAILNGYSDRDVELWIENPNRGFYSMSLSCDSPVCARPIITGEPSDQTVKPGGHAELSLELDGTLPVKVEWMESDGTSWSGGPTFLTPTLLSDRTFTATVTNACGSTQSRAVTVHVDNTSRHRRVPH
ncbi:MAG: hypothetical protein QOI24_2558 [Acidobacteriota bacterium]|nr:hypothetical protein [Acidobacteriota bacterium]